MGVITFTCLECDKDHRVPNPIGKPNCPDCGKPMIKVDEK